MGYFHQNAPGGAAFTNNGLDYRGDLNIIQHRGMFQVQPKYPGRSINGAVMSYVTRFVLHHPAPNPSNTIKLAGLLSRVYEAQNSVSSAVTSAASTDLKLPANYTYTNGIRMFSNHYISNNEVRIQVQSNYFPNYSIGAYPTGRLLIKA